MKEAISVWVVGVIDREGEKGRGRNEPNKKWRDGKKNEGIWAWWAKKEIEREKKREKRGKERRVERGRKREEKHREK